MVCILQTKQPYKVAEDIVWTGYYYGKLSGVNGRSILKADEAYFLQYEYDNDAYSSVCSIGRVVANRFDLFGNVIH